jgi:hypothetical protein
MQLSETCSQVVGLKKIKTLFINNNSQKPTDHKSVYYFIIWIKMLSDITGWVSSFYLSFYSTWEDSMHPSIGSLWCLCIVHTEEEPVEMIVYNKYTLQLHHLYEYLYDILSLPGQQPTQSLVSTMFPPVWSKRTAKNPRTHTAWRRQQQNYDVTSREPRQHNVAKQIAI